MAKHRSGLQKNISAIFESAPALNNEESVTDRSFPDNKAASTEPEKYAPETVENTLEKPQVPAQEKQTPNPSQEQLSSAVSSVDNSSASKLSVSDTPEKTLPVPDQQKSVEPAPSSAQVLPKKHNIPGRPKNRKAVSGSKILTKIKDRFFAPKPGLSTQRQIATALFIPILAIVFISMLIKAFGLPGTKKAKAQAEAPETALKASSAKLDWQIPESYPTDMRDPMKLYKEANLSGESDRIAIKGILHSDDNPAVIINDKIIHEGERIGSTLVVKINIDSIEFESNGDRWTQTFRR